MKLSSASIERTLDQFDAEALPDNHPAMPQLTRLFGDHTFFLDDKGLHIVEPAEQEMDGVREGNVVKLASWGDASPASLTPHAPEPTDVVVDLGPDHPLQAD